MATQVAIGALKAIHDATHPGATNRPHRRPTTSDTATPDTEGSAALLAALDAEADDEEESCVDDQD